MRTIIVASPAANKAKKIEDFNGSTWGDLKQHSTVRELMVGSVEALVSPGNVTLNREDAVLPEGDFKLYLVPTKNKAGISDRDAQNLANEIAQAISKASKASEAADLEDLKKELIETVENFYDVDLNSNSIQGSSSSNSELDQALQDARRFV